MTYIFLVGGKGSRLHPLTLSTPKTLYKLDQNTTIVQRMIQIILECDKTANIVVVGGFLFDTVKSNLQEFSQVKFVLNPFYDVTNSIASLWFAKEYLQGEVTIINGDIVMEEALVRDIVCKSTEAPLVLVDSSIKNNGDYNVQVLGDRILVMSKGLEDYFGEYAGVTKLDLPSSGKLKNKVNQMLEKGMYDQWYENALVQMIFDEDFNLYYKDISQYKWVEVDCVSDMLLAKRIHKDMKQ